MKKFLNGTKNFLEASLSVKRLSKLYLDSAEVCWSKPTPSYLNSANGGIDADLWIMVLGVTTTEGYLARAGACNLSPVNNRYQKNREFRMHDLILRIKIELKKRKILTC